MSTHNHAARSLVQAALREYIHSVGQKNAPKIINFTTTEWWPMPCPTCQSHHCQGCGAAAEAGSVPPVEPLLKAPVTRHQSEELRATILALPAGFLRRLYADLYHAGQRIDGAQQDGEKYERSLL